MRILLELGKDKRNELIANRQERQVLRQLEILDNDTFNNPNGQRDYQYLLALREYNDHRHESNRMRRKQQWIFFWVITAILIIVTGGSGVVVLMVVKDGINIEGLGVVATAVAAMIGAIIVLPKIIAENLFPSGGNSTESELLKVISDYDLKEVKEDMNLD
mgnify:CR=1 FL=1